MLKTRSMIASVGNHVLYRRGLPRRLFHGSFSIRQNYDDDEEVSLSHQQPEEHKICNEKYSGFLSIRESSENKGFGLFASRDFEVGDFIMSSNVVQETATRGSHTVQIGWTKHILMDLPAVLINHSCDANVGIRNNYEKESRLCEETGSTQTDDSCGSYDFWAIRPIQKGEELTWDYEASEWEISTPFRCGCGSPKCRGILSGFKDSGDVIRGLYGEYYADYLKVDRGD